MCESLSNSFDLMFFLLVVTLCHVWSRTDGVFLSVNVVLLKAQVCCAPFPVVVALSSVYYPSFSGVRLSC